MLSAVRSHDCRRARRNEVIRSESIQNHVFTKTGAYVNQEVEPFILASYRQLKALIKFQLSNLRAENDFHVFESVCRQFSRIRIGLNVLPATGPVSSGGDQGRDFETYQVMEARPLASTGSARMQPKSAAFACTAQQDDLPSKIKSDVANMVVGKRIDIAYYFSVKDVAVSARHKLQKWASEMFELELEIFDGEALSEELASHDLFWIAVEYLHVSGDAFPPVEDIDYAKLKEKWESKEPLAANYGHFQEIRGLARRALHDETLKQDLLFWLEKLRTMAEMPALGDVFARKVRFELIALRVRGMKDLIDWEPHVRKYFDLVSTIVDPTEAKDAAVAWVFVHAAVESGGANLNSDEMKKWRVSIRKYVDDEIETKTDSLTHATLLELDGYLFITDPYHPDIDRCIEIWDQLADIIDAIPLFPLETFTDMLAELAPYVREHAKYSSLIETTDALLSKRIGNFAVADQCRTRAINYYDHEMPVMALREFHNAKVQWFAEETLYGSILSMLMISQIYSELRLVYAAKYYALSALFAATHTQDSDVKILVPQALASLTEAEYLNGEWGHFFIHSDFAMQTLGAIAPDVDDPKSKEIWSRLIFYSATALAITGAIGSTRNNAFAQNITDKWQSEELDELLSHASPTWTNMPIEDLFDTLTSNFVGLPFSDAPTIRNSKWASSGLEWNFQWKSGLNEDATAEHLMTVLQVLSAELADRDTYFLKTKVNVAITFGKDFRVDQVSSGYEDVVSYDVSIPLAEGTKLNIPRSRSFVELATTLLLGLSVLPEAKLKDRIEKLFEQGLTSKVLAVNSYETVFKAAHDWGMYTELQANEFPGPLNGIESHPVEHSALAWIDSEIDEFVLADQLELIRNRYDNSEKPIAVTLALLRDNDQFVRTIASLRAQGWKDWHILMSIVNLAVNYRVHTMDVTGPLQTREAFMKLFSGEEESNAVPIPVEEFSEKQLKFGLSLTLPSTFKGIGLDLRLNPINFEAMFDFLGQRMSYWDIDVEHRDILPQTGTSNQFQD